jgi:PAS domain S-box-containing protein
MTISSGNDVTQSPEMARSFLQSEGEMARYVANFDWSTHPLGPLEQWPQSLKTAVSLILNSRHPMWIGWGREMSFLYNDAYLHVLGLEKHPLALGRPAAEVWAEIWDVCGPLAEKVFNHGEASFVDDVRLLLSRGDLLEETFYSFSYSPIRDEFGAVAGLFCPSNDVTSKVLGARRSRTLAELVANALVQKSTAAACASAAATLAKNPNDVPFALLYLVDGDQAMLEQAVGVAGNDPFVSPGAVDLDEGLDAPDDLGATIARVIREGRSHVFSMRSIHQSPPSAEGRPVVDVFVLPVAGRAEVRPLGALVAAISPTRPFDDEYRAFYELVASNIGTAIHNARAAEEEKKRLDFLAEMDRAKTAFFSNVSHEFRTPLTLMLGLLSQLSQTDDERHRALARTARRNALRLLKLVNTLLEFSRLEAGRNDAAFAPTDLAALTRDVASSFRSAIESVGLRFVVDAQLDEPVFVDGSMWERILLNLLSNALKFTLEGEIRVTLRRTENVAELCITDTGVGIAPGELPRLFERFHRVRGATSRTHEGTGIGLALVRDLAALHGGTIDVESVAGQGTTFRVRIPLGSAHLDPALIVSRDAAVYQSAADQYLADVDATITYAGTETLNTKTTDERERILLADDNADLREYVAGILSGRYDITAVRNGREALEAARRESFQLIVSDVMMPEMDGFELLQAVRADDSISATPFIMLSARAGQEAAVEGLLEGADDYIVKPFSADELLARVYAQINAASIRERATHELRASEERFRTLASSLPYIIFEADASGAFSFLSDEYTTYTGLTPDSGYGSGWTSLVQVEDVDDTRRAWATALATGDFFSHEFCLRSADGTYRTFVARARPQRDANGAITRWIGTMTDVHDQRQAAREREFLLRASEIFARSLDLDATLRATAEFTVPDIADWCQIDLRMDDGRIKTVAVAHRDREKNRLAERLVGRVHLNTRADHGSPYVIRTGKAELVDVVSPDMLLQAVGDADEVGVYRDLGVRSSVIVPLVAEGETLGSVSVVYGSSSRQYGKDDVPMLEELGRRAGLAIHKTRLFEREHRAAQSFQEASLPATLPSAPGLALDAFYAPGRTEAQVGGDWYDAVRLVDGRVVISIGDVAGSGLQAAVTMGNMRQIIRGIAQVHADPALMLDAADRALRLENPEKFVTAFVGVVDPINGVLTYASAGQPPPLLRRPDGETEALAGNGLPLGLRSNAEKSSSLTIDLPAGSSLVLYTDGLTEFEREPLSGENRLRDLVSRIVDEGHREPARALVEHMMNGEAAHDDVAVMVVTVGTPLERDARDRELLQRWSIHTDEMHAVSAARRDFARSFRDHGATLDDVAVAELVFGELVGNAVRYAPGAVDVIADWSGADPVLHVLDRGPGFRHIAILPPDLLSESGRGLFIVSALTQDFRVAKGPKGGSHARAVLRMRSRQLVDIPADAISTSAAPAFGELIGFMTE